MQNGSSVGIGTHCIYTLHAQSAALIISALELSRMFIKSALLVGKLQVKLCSLAFPPFKAERKLCKIGMKKTLLNVAIQGNKKKLFFCLFFHWYGQLFFSFSYLQTEEKKVDFFPGNHDFVIKSFFFSHPLLLFFLSLNWTSTSPLLFVCRYSRTRLCASQQLCSAGKDAYKKKIFFLPPTDLSSIVSVFFSFFFSLLLHVTLLEMIATTTSSSSSSSSCGDVRKRRKRSLFCIVVIRALFCRHLAKKLCVWGGGEGQLKKMHPPSPCLSYQGMQLL